MARRAPLCRSQSVSSLRRRDDIGVFAQTWTRQLNKDNRVYYFNRSTGASQWHIPNELYQAQNSLERRRSSVMDAMGELKGVGLSGIRMLRKSNSEALLMPGHARACRKVDCMTESFIPKEESAPSTERSPNEDGPRKDALLERLALRVYIHSASGLRDADACGDLRDLSDPYCVCEFQNSQFQTHVVDNSLDPVWEFEGTLESPEAAFAGDTLKFLVFDDDADDVTTLMEKVGNDLCDFLGSAELSIDDAMKLEGPIVLNLEDAGQNSGKPVTAKLTVEVSGPCVAFPGLVGMDIIQAVQMLKEQRPDLLVRVFELASKDVTCSVVSCDAWYSRNGYAKRFFGAIDADAARFKKGDKVEFFPKLWFTRGQLVGDRKKPQTYTVDKVVAAGGRHKGKEVVYVHIQEEAFKVPVRDDMQWRRLPVNPDTGRVGPLPGYMPHRVCLHFDPETGKVGPLPRTG
eukprot:TRINITY_DN6813_c0_g2_i1.p1 TRINITY_DN6813_c0_g2~~TRINITY_DN6813_c0_g2_i1.p1  ORF type:complete len:467 (-),score=75.23 TRINITY_DN6813_c0_g2_i1:64-1443(-)